MTNDSLSRWTAESGHLLIGGDGTYGTSSNGPWVMVAAGGTLRRHWYTDGERRERFFGEDETLLIIDVRPDDREYWQQIRRFLTWLWEGAVPRARGPWVRVAYKKLRQQHHGSKSKDWDEALPPEIADWAHSEIDRAIVENYADCPDNSRCARIDSTAQKRRYRQQKKNGCCGFADWIATGPDGKCYMLGYNYGH